MALDEVLSLSEAVGSYVSSFQAKDNQEQVHRELYRFVHWCGPEKTFLEISPPEIGEYADRLSGPSSGPEAAERLQIVKGFLSYAKKKGLTNMNLAQHVRVRKSKARAKDRQARDSQDFVGLTPEGHAQLLAQLEKLKGERPTLAIQIRKAAADKDVRENVPLEAAREQLGLVESQIMRIEGTLKSAVILDPSSGERALTVKLGVWVSVKDSNTGRKMRYMLVNASEANPAGGKISDGSPLGKAFMGRSVGQEVDVQTPGGKLRYSIIGVST